MISFSRPAPLSPGQNMEGFSCGVEEIDFWVQHYASNARKRGTAVVYVSYCQENIAGFYTLSTHSVARAEVTGGWVVRNTPDQIPALLLGMLGVDTKFQGLGLGAALLRDAILNAFKVAELAGAKILVVDPINESSRTFYEHYGFAALPGTKRMFLRLK